MASKTTIVDLEGIAYWARVFEDNRDMIGYKPSPDVKGTFEDCEGAYTMDLYLEPEEATKLKESGSALQGGIDERGFRVRLKRKHRGPFAAASGAPKVVKEDDTEWDFEEDGPIGNGSKVKVRVSVYTTSMTPGTRLEKVKVIEHVPMETGDKVSEVESIPF